MLEFQWNALRVGDRVSVHDDRDADLGRHDAVVTMVQTRVFGANDVGLRRTDGASAALRPRRHAVHLLPLDPYRPCWRCEASSRRQVTS